MKLRNLGFGLRITQRIAVARMNMLLSSVFVHYRAKPLALMSLSVFRTEIPPHVYYNPSKPSNQRV